MVKFWKIFGIFVAFLFIVLGFYILFGPTFKEYPPQVKIIFSIFLFLYGAYRMTRYIFKNREKDNQPK